MRITLFYPTETDNTARNPQGRTFECSWEELCRIFQDNVEPREVDKLMVMGWSPVSFKGGYRNSENAEDISAIGFDVDQSPYATREQLEGCLPGYRIAFHTTCNYSPSVPKWRLIVPLKRAIRLHEWETVREELRSRLPFKVDPGALDPTRYWVGPRQPVVGDYVFRARDGELFDPDSLVLPKAGESKKTPGQSSPDADQNDPEALAGAEALCQTWDYSCDGGKLLFALCGRLIHEYELSDAQALDIVTRIYLPRVQHKDCANGHVGPKVWQPHEVERKVRDARAKFVCVPTSFDFFEQFKRSEVLPLPSLPSDLPPRRVRDRSHEYTHTYSNALDETKTKAFPLQYVIGTLIYGPDWGGCFQYDEFKRKKIVVNPPVRLELESGEGELTDEDITAVRTWLESKGVKIGHDDTKRAILSSIKAQSYHPVRDYLRGLPEGDPAYLDRFAVEVFGFTGWEAKFLRNTLIAAVRRILVPGTKVDTVLVFVGEQGRMKSSSIEALFGQEWTTTQIAGLENRDGSMSLDGFWCVEFEELDRILRSDNTTVKAFLSRNVDRYRQMQVRDKVERPRQNIFTATTNDKRFLRDPTGNRRFLPVEVRHRLNPDHITKVRDEVWASAFALAMSGERHWIQDDTEVNKYREQFYDDPPWLEEVRSYCAGRRWVRGPLHFYQSRIDPSLKGYDKKTRAAIKECYQRIGFVREDYNKRFEGEQTKVWEVPEGLRLATPSTEELEKRSGETDLNRINDGKTYTDKEAN